MLHAAARRAGSDPGAQMATTVGFHISLACVGIALLSIVLLAEYIGLRRRDEAVMRLARRRSQGWLVATRDRREPCRLLDSRGMAVEAAGRRQRRPGTGRLLPQRSLDARR
jgi:hypothetical protein